MTSLAFEFLRLFTFLHTPKFTVTNLPIYLVIAVVVLEGLAILIAHLLYRDTDEDRENQWRGKDL